MKTQIRRQLKTDGSILIVTIFAAFLMGMTLCSYLVLTGAQDQSVVRSQHWNGALALAEAGVEEALAQMNSGTNVGGTSYLSLNGWGGLGGVYGPISRNLTGGSYRVGFVISPTPTIYSTGSAAMAISGAVITRVVKVTAQQLPLFNVPLGASYDIDMRGNGAATDSWNWYSTNLSNNGVFDPNKTSTNGSVASAQGLVNIGNHTIEGNLYLGPTASYSSGTNQISGTIYYDYNVQFPDVALPIPASSFVAPPTSGSGGSAVHDFSVPGNYWVNDSTAIKVEAGVTVTLHVTTSSFAPASVTILGGLTNSGTLIVYQDSGSVSLGGNSTGGAIANRPINFQYYGLPGVTSITLGGTSTFIGVIYAPEAALTLNGGGSGNNLEGSAIVNSVRMNGHYDFHYDESLETNGPTKGFVAASWQEL